MRSHKDKIRLGLFLSLLFQVKGSTNPGVHRLPNYCSVIWKEWQWHPVCGYGQFTIALHLWNPRPSTIRQGHLIKVVTLITYKYWWLPVCTALHLSDFQLQMGSEEPNKGRTWKNLSLDASPPFKPELLENISVARRQNFRAAFWKISLILSYLFMSKSTFSSSNTEF